MKYKNNRNRNIINNFLKINIIDEKNKLLQKDMLKVSMTIIYY